MAVEDKALLAEIEMLLGRVISMGRAVGVKVLISTQRPRVDDLPVGVWNLVSPAPGPADAHRGPRLPCGYHYRRDWAEPDCTTRQHQSA